MSILSNRGMIRSMLCLMVAATITLGGWWGFQVSTAQAPGTPAAALSVASAKMPLAHGVFGRPEPAVLVD